MTAHTGDQRMARFAYMMALTEKRSIRDWALDVVPAANRFSERRQNQASQWCNVIVHKDYLYESRVPKANDIALIELADETPWTEAVMPLSIDASTDPPENGTGTILEVAGFGRIEGLNFESQTTVVGSSYFVSYVDRLQSVGLPSIANDQCRAMNSTDTSFIGPNRSAPVAWVRTRVAAIAEGPYRCATRTSTAFRSVSSAGEVRIVGQQAAFKAVLRASIPGLSYHDWIIGHTGPLDSAASAATAAASRSFAEVEGLLSEMQALFVDDPRVGEMVLTAVRTDGSRIDAGGMTSSSSAINLLSA